MNKLNASVYPLVGLSVVLSLSALIAVAANYPGHSTVYANAAAAKPAAAVVKNVRVVMHDPGCHFFQTANGLKTGITVSGPVKLSNFDEATLRVAGSSKTQLDKVGSSLKLGPGTYRITMVGQAPDDNHLKLVVRS